MSQRIVEVAEEFTSVNERLLVTEGIDISSLSRDAQLQVMPNMVVLYYVGNALQGVLPARSVLYTINPKYADGNIRLIGVNVAPWRIDNFGLIDVVYTDENGNEKCLSLNQISIEVAVDENRLGVFVDNTKSDCFATAKQFSSKNKFGGINLQNLAKKACVEKASGMTKTELRSKEFLTKLQNAIRQNVAQELSKIGLLVRSVRVAELSLSDKESETAELETIELEEAVVEAAPPKYTEKVCTRPCGRKFPIDYKGKFCPSCGARLEER